MPKIVCLCGSTRFMDAFYEATCQETLKGHIVLSVGVSKADFERLQINGREDVKVALDELHLRKIDLADEVLVLNVGGYVGISTQREIAYARSRGTPVRFLESEMQL